jgi:cell division septation protein DedD
MRCVAFGAIALSAMLAGCAETSGIPDFQIPDLQLALAGLNPDSSQAQASAPQTLNVDKNDPAFRYADLKAGLTTDRLQGMYGTRLVRMDGDGTYDRYVVEPSNATPGVPQQRSRLVLWVMDGHLATWAVEDTKAPVAIAMDLPTTRVAQRAQPVAHVAPERTRATTVAGSTFQVQIAARKSEDEARAAIAELRNKYPNLLAQRGALIYRISLPNGVFYRAVVGPIGSSIQANELCGQLRAAGAECFVRAG